LFGIASAPAIWQRTIDQILQGLKGVYCILDDMVITGKDDKQHLNNLSKVLVKSCDNNLPNQEMHVLLLLFLALVCLKQLPPFSEFCVIRVYQ
jgi:hypothetical protein